MPKGTPRHFYGNRESSSTQDNNRDEGMKKEERKKDIGEMKGYKEKEKRNWSGAKCLR